MINYQKNQHWKYVYYVFFDIYFMCDTLTFSFFSIKFSNPWTQRQLECSTAESVKLLWSSKQLKCHSLHDFCQAHNMAHSSIHTSTFYRTVTHNWGKQLGVQHLAQGYLGKPTIFQLVDNLLHINTWSLCIMPVVFCWHNYRTIFD